jgi:hypothetical protein
MWGHYAGAGMGVAIEIEVRDRSRFKKVSYGVAANHDYSSVEEILSNKSKVWRYEREWRYITNSQKAHFEYAIKKIYFGAPYEHLENYEELKTEHKKLSSYLKYSALLKAECVIRGIQISKIDLSYKPNKSFQHRTLRVLDSF